MKKKSKSKKTPVKTPKPKKKINSRNKGKVGELEFCAFLKERGITARRGQQYEGSSDSPDVVAGGPMMEFHVEVKRKESGNVYDWLDQACADADLCSVPLVAHRKNDRRWIVIIDARDFINLVEKAHIKEKTNAFTEVLAAKMSENLDNFITGKIYAV